MYKILWCAKECDHWLYIWGWMFHSSIKVLSYQEPIMCTVTDLETTGHHVCNCFIRFVYIIINNIYNIWSEIFWSIFVFYVTWLEQVTFLWTMQPTVLFLNDVPVMYELIIITTECKRCCGVLYHAWGGLWSRNCWSSHLL